MNEILPIVITLPLNAGGKSFTDISEAQKYFDNSPVGTQVWQNIPAQGGWIMTHQK